MAPPSGAYYNEIKPFPAKWLRRLMQEGLIADGDIDTRSVVDVSPDDLRGYAQCHFFAGIGGWSYALRLAGWPDDRPIWTGSCPCQPFSHSGSKTGAADPRDLWPSWFRLIRECRPAVLVGEQVETAIAHGWLDRLCDDLEGEDYAVAAVGLCAASVGAPQKRDRLWFVGERRSTVYRDPDGVLRCATCGCEPLGGDCWCPHGEWECMDCGEWTYPFFYDRSDGCQWCGSTRVGESVRARGRERVAAGDDAAHVFAPSPWLDGIRHLLPDGRLLVAPCLPRPVADGIPYRMGRLRGYGNAVVPQVAAQLIRAYMDGEHDRSTGGE